jgi:uncharacterized membrane protein YqjE
MNNSTGEGRGWIESLRRAGDALLGLAQSRCELFAVELQEEKLRAVNAVVWLVEALTLGAAGLLVALGALAIYLWAVAGYLGLAGLSIGLLGAAGGVFVAVRHRLRSGPPPFAETIAEFRKDRECLRSEK